MADLTPMQKQYRDIKKKHSDCLLFFRLGDFYELFDEDARLASQLLNLALTTRDRNKPPEEQTPMCGVPYHSADTYIGRLIDKGYKVAICEQLEDPAQTKGLVERDVIRIITPGTVTDDAMLEQKRSNYLAAVYLQNEEGGICIADISAGEMFVSGYAEQSVSHILNELARFSPREVVLSEDAIHCTELTTFLTERLKALVEPDDGRFAYAEGVERIRRQFQTDTLERLGLEGEHGAVCAVGALLAYMGQTQMCQTGHFSGIELLHSGKYMELDYTTIRNLELTRNLRSGEVRGSLLWVLDQTKTPMGGRMMRAWIERPLMNPTVIRRRSAAVAELVRDTVLRRELMTRLRNVGDFRRGIGRCVYGNASGRDVKNLGAYCAELPDILTQLSGVKSAMLREIARTDPLTDIADLAAKAICDDPPLLLRDGGILRKGYSRQVDSLREIKENGRQMLIDLGERERARTGIKKLKVGYNRVFGYYLDVPRSAGDMELPADYIRKQTLVNNERYYTPELKELEEKLQNAEAELNQLEFTLFNELRETIAGQVARVHATADAVAALDVLCALAEVAVRNGYCCPEVDMGSALEIVEGRHPVVEIAQEKTSFVPNDALLNDSGNLVSVITGPNMAGKSTYMRQTALITLMAQMGSFVPAKRATIGIVDRVFTRIGASDDLTAGQSTFMVEMVEVAYIMKYATRRSLLILDEIGRGTSTYDGMAIARAVLEYCANKRRLGAKTMFATHYHELGTLEQALPGVVNYHITAKKQDGKLIFLRKIVRGCAAHSYGIEVASLAGVPEEIISRAKACLRELEAAGAALDTPPAEVSNQISLADTAGTEVLDDLRQIDLNTLSPLDAFNLLHELKKKVDR